MYVIRRKKETNTKFTKWILGSVSKTLAVGEKSPWICVHSPKHSFHCGKRIVVNFSQFVVEHKATYLVDTSSHSTTSPIECDTFFELRGWHRFRLCIASALQIALIYLLHQTLGKQNKNNRVLIFDCRCRHPILFIAHTYRAILAPQPLVFSPEARDQPVGRTQKRWIHFSLQK